MGLRLGESPLVEELFDEIVEARIADLFGDLGLVEGPALAPSFIPVVADPNFAFGVGRVAAQYGQGIEILRLRMTQAN